MFVEPPAQRLVGFHDQPFLTNWGSVNSANLTEVSGDVKRFY